jgi:hypothetical protein
LAELFWSSVFNLTTLEIMHFENIRSKGLIIAFTNVFLSTLESGNCGLAALEIASAEEKYALENLSDYLASVCEAGRVSNYSLFHMWL